MKEVIFNPDRVPTGRPDRICFTVPEHVQHSLAHLVREIELMRSGYTVRISPKLKPRTTGPQSQSAHFNGHIQQIAEYTGHDFDEIKMALKQRALKRGYGTYTTIDGQTFPKSEAKSTTVECGYLIEESHQLAAELSIRLKEGYEQD